MLKQECQKNKNIRPEVEISTDKRSVINPFLYILCPLYFSDDTYMYDDAARGHWYDEPPYESDPDDFLMTGIGLDPAAATIQVSFYRRFTSIVMRWVACLVSPSTAVRHGRDKNQ